MEHRDSMGNTGDLQPGDAQWMCAGSGVIHSEMPKQSEGLMRGFQLWINLPAAQKMSEPAYQELADARFPRATLAGGEVKVLLGRYGEVSGPIHDPHTEVQYLDVRLKSDAVFEHRLPGGFNAFLYLYEGAFRLAGQDITEHQLLVLGAGDEIQVRGGSDGARFIAVAGRPIGEPIVQYGPFVMNTEDEIRQAIAAYHQGVLVRSRATMHTG